MKIITRYRRLPKNINERYFGLDLSIHLRKTIGQEITFDKQNLLIPFPFENMQIFLSQTNKNYKENYDSLFVSYDNVINTLIDQIINRDAIKKSKYYCCYNFAFNHWITNNSLLIDYDEQEEDISKIDKILATGKEIVEIYRSNRESTRYQWPNLTLYHFTFLQ